MSVIEKLSKLTLNSVNKKFFYFNKFSKILILKVNWLTKFKANQRITLYFYLILILFISSFIHSNGSYLTILYELDSYASSSFKNINTLLSRFSSCVKLFLVKVPPFPTSVPSSDLILSDEVLFPWMTVDLISFANF